MENENNMLGLLEEKADKLKTVINAYPDLLAVAKRFDGKIMNKRFVSFIESEAPIFTVSYGTSPYGYNTSYHRLAIWLSNSGGLNCYPELIDVSSCERHLIVKDKRFNFDGFKDFADQRLESLTKEFNAIKQDMKDGEKRLDQYNQLVKQLNTLKDSFSNEFLVVYNRYFNKVYM